METLSPVSTLSGISHPSGLISPLIPPTPSLSQTQTPIMNDNKSFSNFVLQKYEFVLILYFCIFYILNNIYVYSLY